jgi:hypothetical protein
MLVVLPSLVPQNEFDCIFSRKAVPQLSLAATALSKTWHVGPVTILDAISHPK